MSPEAIKEIKAKHPQLFADKRAVLGSDKSAASVIARQVEYDAENPPSIGATMKARHATDYANALLQMFFNAKHGAELLRTAALGLDPEAELPEIDGAGNVSVGMLEATISDLRAQAEQDSLNISVLKGELTAAQELLAGENFSEIQSLMQKLRGCSNIKEVRDVFAEFDADAAGE